MKEKMKEDETVQCFQLHRELQQFNMYRHFGKNLQVIDSDQWPLEEDVFCILSWAVIMIVDRNDDSTKYAALVLES